MWGLQEKSHTHIIDMIMIIKTATRWCKNIKIFTTRLCKNIEIFTRWCKNTKEPWYSDSVVSYLEEQRALVGVLHKDNYLGSFYSFHIITKGQKWSHTTRMSRSIWFQEYSLCCRASRLTKRSTWGQSPSEFRLKRSAFASHDDGHSQTHASTELNQILNFKFKMEIYDYFVVGRKTILWPGFDKGLCDCVRGCRRLLQV